MENILLYDNAMSAKSGGDLMENIFYIHIYAFDLSQCQKAQQMLKIKKNVDEKKRQKRCLQLINILCVVCFILLYFTYYLYVFNQ